MARRLGVLAMVLLAVMGHGGEAGPPADLVIPDPTTAPLPAPALTPCGAPLVVSNTPENVQLAAGQAGLALYRTTLTTGSFRLFFHHQVLGRPAWLGPVVANRGDCPLQILAGLNTQGLGGGQPLTPRDPVGMGLAVQRSWFRRLASEPAEQLLATLQPGESWSALQAVGAGQTLTVMDNFQLSATRGEPRAEVAVVALADRAGDPWGLPLAVPDPQGPVRCRGWFDHADRQGQVTVPLTRVQWLDLAGPTRGPYARHLPGEYEPNREPGEDLNRGNYGVLYELEVSLENPGPAALTPYLLLNSAGGPGGLVATVDGELKTSRMLPAYGSMLLARPAVPAGGVTVVKLVFSLPGGASGAHRLFFWPAP